MWYNEARTFLTNIFHPGFCVEQIERAEKGIRITARATSSSACCPDCQQASSRVHSYYTRCLMDLPVTAPIAPAHARRLLNRCPTSSCRMRNGRPAYERASESSEKKEAGKRVPV